MQEQVIEKIELKIPTTLKALVESLIFAAREPLSIEQIRSVYEEGDTRGDITRKIEPEVIKQIITDLNTEYLNSDKPYRIVQIAGGYQFATLPEYAEWLGILHKEQGRRKLSQSSIETLSIIAYKQPITKAEIEKIRGVNCDYVLKTLLEKELTTVIGRAETVGRPLLYGTTKEFLKHFGLNDITDLPRPREIEEILGESQFETERRMLEAQAGAEQAKKEQEDFKSRLPHIPKKRSDLDEKEVKIVPQKKTRQIKVMPVERRKALEEAGQEKIEFNIVEETVPPEEPKLLSVKVEETQSELPEITNIENISENDVEQESYHQSAEMPEFDKVPDNTLVEVEPVILHESGIKKEQSGYTEERIDAVGADISPTEEAQHPKRWKIWKEKIRGFIKKLFA